MQSIPWSDLDSKACCICQASVCAHDERVYVQQPALLGRNNAQLCQVQTCTNGALHELVVISTVHVNCVLSCHHAPEAQVTLDHQQYRMVASSPCAASASAYTLSSSLVRLALSTSAGLPCLQKISILQPETRQTVHLRLNRCAVLGDDWGNHTPAALAPRMPSIPPRTAACHDQGDLEVVLLSRPADATCSTWLKGSGMIKTNLGA